MKRSILNASITSLIAVVPFNQAAAENVLFYVDGLNLEKTSLFIEDELYFLDKNSSAFADLPAGEYQVRIVEDDTEVSAFSIMVSANTITEVVGKKNNDELEIQNRSYPESEQERVGRVIGRVFSTGGETPLANARIRVLDTDLKTVTDNTGAYSIDIPSGVHTIVISDRNHVERRLEDVVIVSELTLEASLSLSEVTVGVMEEVLIMGVRGAMTESSLAIERDANSVVDAISAEEFKKFGDSSATDALKRLTGVSVIGDQYVVVRGLDGRYISTTLDSGLLPSTDPLKRDVPLDLFPANTLKGIEVSKSFRPELPGDSTGGHVGMNLKDMPKEYINKLGFELGYNTIATGDDVISYSGGGRDYLGIDDGTREIPSNVNAASDYGSKTLSECIDLVPIPNCTPAAEIRELGASFRNIYAIKKSKAKPNTKLSYSLGNVFDVSAGEIGVYGAVDHKQKWSFRDAASTSETRTDVTGYEPSETKDYQRSKYSVDLTGLLVAGFDNQTNSKIHSKTLILRKTEDVTKVQTEVDIENNKVFEETTLQWVERQLFDQLFSGEHTLDSSEQHTLEWLVDIANSKRNEPDKRRYTYENGNLTPTTIFRSYSELDEDATNIGVDYSYEFTGPWGSDSTLKTGLFGYDKERDFRLARYGFLFRDSTLDRTDDIENIMTSENFTDGKVKLTSQNDDNDWYSASETLNAFYLSGEFSLDDTWTVLLGARYEEATQEIAYTDEDAKAIPVDKKYDDILPAVNFTLRQTNGNQWRLAFSQTVSRPGFVEINSSSQFDPETDQQIIGNPNLETASVNNFDARYEYYWDDDQSLSVGVFAKEIDKPIEKAIAEGKSVDKAYTFRHSDSATLIGLELDIQKTIASFDSWEVSLGGNVSIIDAEVTLDDKGQQLEGREKRKLQGQSEFLANLNLGFIDVSGVQSVYLVTNYFGDRIDVVNNASSGDRIEVGRVLLDAVYRYEFDSGLQIDAKAKNLLDEEVTYTVQGQRQRLYEEYEEGVTLSIGITYPF